MAPLCPSSPRSAPLHPARLPWVCAALAFAAACSTAETPPPRGALVPPTGHPARAAPPPLPSQAPGASLPPPPAPEPACEPLKAAGFDRPQHDSIALADVPIQWGERLASFYETLARLKHGP